MNASPTAKHMSDVEEFSMDLVVHVGAGPNWDRAH